MENNDHDNKNKSDNVFFNPDEPSTSMAGLTSEGQEATDEAEWLPVDILVTPPTPSASPGGTRRHQPTRMHETYNNAVGLVPKKEEPKPKHPLNISIIVKEMKTLEMPETPRRKSKSFPSFSSTSQEHVRHNRHLLEVPPLRRGRNSVSATHIPSCCEPSSTITRPPADELESPETQKPPAEPTTE